MARTADELTPEELAFLTEPHLATLTTVRADGSPHVVAIAFTFDPDHDVVRIITTDGTSKVRNVRRDGRAAVCQVSGSRWLTLAGPATVSVEPDRVATAVAAYEKRYRPARVNPRRVVIEIEVRSVLGQA